jgi:alkaline phosphatase D
MPDAALPDVNPSPGPRRRSVLAGGAGAAALAPLAIGGDLTGTTSASAATPAAKRMFRHGVASGDPRPRSVVLWTRVTPTKVATPGSGKGPKVTVHWEVATDQRFRHVVRRGRLVTGAKRDHTVKVDATGLRADQWYYFRFRVYGVTSPVGRTRTAPRKRAEVQRLRVGVVSCSQYVVGYFAAYRHLANHAGLDAVIHLGDYIYEGGNKSGGVRTHEPPHEILSLADYRQRHGQYKTDPDLQRLHALVPFIATWDDHEVANDNWSGGAENHDPSEGSYLTRKAQAQRAYDEWMPVRMSGTAKPGDGTKLFRRLRWGRLADIAMLDLRSYRDEQITTDVPFPLPQLQTEADDPGRTITGNQQMVWLKRVLRRKKTQWKLIGNSVMIAPLSFAQLPTDAVEAINQVTGEVPSDGVPLNLDQWDGYTADRRELFAHMVEHRVKNAVFLTGDIHSAWANDLPIDTGTYPVTGSVGVEFVCTSVTSDNIDEETGAPPRTATLALEAVLQTNNRHVRYLNFDDHGYSVLDLTPQRAQMDYYVLADKRRADTTASHAASWLTRSGTGTVEAADGPVT